MILNGTGFGDIYLAGEALMPYWDHKVDGDRILVGVGENCIVLRGSWGHMLKCPEIILTKVRSGLTSANLGQFLHPLRRANQPAFYTSINASIEHQVVG